jgi:hypothetical protein
MRYILILLLFISGAASAQFAPTSAKTKFVNGIAIGSKDTSAFSAADTMVLTIARDSVIYYKYRGVWRPIATGGNLNNYKLISDTLFNNGYTTRGRTKQGLDSLGVLKLNISDTAAMLANRLKISDTLTMLSKLSLDRVLINGNTSGRGVVLGTGSFTSSGSSNTVEINHLSGSGAALSISKDGNDEGLRVTKLSGSGNAATIIGTLNATTLVKSGGTSSQFLMADGSVNTSVLPSGAYLPLSGGTLTGALNGTSLAFSGAGVFGGTLEASINDGGSTWVPIITMTNNSIGANDYSWGKLVVNDLALKNNNNNYYPIYFQNQGTYANVGVGTTAPNVTLDVRSSSVSTPSFIAAGNSDISKFISIYGGTSVDAVSAIWWKNGQSLKLATATSNNGASESIKILITDAGNVGIGSTSPANLLTLKASVVAPIIDINRSGGGQGKNSGILFRDQVNNEQAAIGTEGQNTNDLQLLSTTAIRFYTSSDLVVSNERMRISSGGNTLIRTTTDNGTDALQVAGSGNFSGQITMAYGGTPRLLLRDTDAGAGNVGILFRENTTDEWTVASVGGDFQIFNEGGLGNALLINGTTNAATFSSTVSASGFIVSSDRRLKNIVSRSGDMVTYTLKADKNKILHYGYIAQEVEKVLPTTVSTDDKGMKAVNYIEVLVKKVNDLEKKIEQLEKLLNK